MKVATGSTKKKGQTQRIQCPACLGAYMQHAYVLVQADKKRNWKSIGKYCTACGHFRTESE